MSVIIKYDSLAIFDQNKSSLTSYNTWYIWVQKYAGFGQLASARGYQLDWSPSECSIHKSNELYVA